MKGRMILHRYTVLEELGKGPFGSVLKVRDEDIGIEAALKIIRRDILPTARSRDLFLKRIMKLRNLGHQNLVRIFDVGQDEECFVVTQLLHGVPLSRLIEFRRDRGRAFELEEVVPILQQMGDLSSAISLTTCHGDIKPANIWILPELLKVTDTGLVKAIPLEMAVSRMMDHLDSRKYLAPEILNGEMPTEYSDVYSTAAMVTEMLTGDIFDGTAPEMSNLPDDTPESVLHLISLALSEDPEDRPATIEELSEKFCHPVTRTIQTHVPSYGDSSVPSSADTVDTDDRNSSEDLTSAVLEATQKTPIPVPRPSDMDDVLENEEVIEEDQDDFSDTQKVSMNEVLKDYVEKSFSQEKKAPGSPPRIKQKTAFSADMDKIKIVQPGISSKSVHAGPPARPTKQIFPMSDPDKTPELPEMPRAPSPEILDSDDESVSVNEESGSPREVTQEVSIEMIEEVRAARESGNTVDDRAAQMDDVDPRLLRAARKLRDQPSPPAAPQAPPLQPGTEKPEHHIKERISELNDVNPRFLRAATRLEEARVKERERGLDSVEEIEAPDPEDDDWRESIARESSNADVISFLAPPTIDSGKSVQGFPKDQPRKMIQPTEGDRPQPPQRSQPSPPPLKPQSRPAIRPQPAVQITPAAPQHALQPAPYPAAVPAPPAVKPPPLRPHPAQSRQQQPSPPPSQRKHRRSSAPPPPPAARRAGKNRDDQASRHASSSLKPPPRPPPKR